MKKLFSSPIILALMFISNINAQISFSNPELLSNISSNASFIIDLDGDSDSDILFSSFSDEALYWLENDGQRNFTQNQIATPSLNIASIYANDIEGDALQGLVLNRVKGSLRVAAIKSPGFGGARHDLLLDLESIVGGKVLDSAFDMTSFESCLNIKFV